MRFQDFDSGIGTWGLGFTEESCGLSVLGFRVFRV